MWNLKSSPVVYFTNLGVFCTPHDGMDIMKESGGRLFTHGLFMMFDPSSVEVELNPEVFPQEDIEWMQVEAFRGTRAINNPDGTDKYRQALDLRNRDLQTVSNGNLTYFRIRNSAMR